MKSILSGDAYIHFEVENLKTNRPTFVLVNSLGTDFRVWDDVARLLAADFNVLRHDKRGHGLSALGNSPHQIVVYAQDIAKLLDTLQIKSAICVGLSVGGLIVQALYHARPDLVSKLVISNSALKIGTAQSWAQRIAAVKLSGIDSIAEAIMKMWFSEEFHRGSPDRLALYRAMMVRTNVDGYLACCEALRDADFTPHARNINVPSLFIAGDRDGSTPAALVEASSKLVVGSLLKIIKNAAHIPCVEKPREYAELLKAFAAQA